MLEVYVICRVEEINYVFLLKERGCIFMKIKKEFWFYLIFVVESIDIEFIFEKWVKKGCFFNKYVYIFL